MEGIQQMFHELMGYEEYQQDLFVWTLRKQQQVMAHAEYEANWRRTFPVQSKARSRRWRKANPDKVRAAQRNKVERNRENYREMWRKSSALYRARKKAEQQARAA